MSVVYNEDPQDFRVVVKLSGVEDSETEFIEESWDSEIAEEMTIDDILDDLMIEVYPDWEINNCWIAEVTIPSMNDITKSYVMEEIYSEEEAIECARQAVESDLIIESSDICLAIFSTARTL